jgi:hypothetical protein
VLVSMLLSPANLERLSDVQVDAIREAARLLSAPSPTVIDAEAVAVPSAGDAEK